MLSIKGGANGKGRPDSPSDISRRTLTHSQPTDLMPSIYDSPRTLEPEFTVLQRMAELDWLQDLDTVSGVPPAMEAHWAAQGQAPRRSRYLPNSHWLAWRLLVAMGLTGWHWLPDLLALEQGAAVGQWSNLHSRAYRRLRTTGCIEIYHISMGRHCRVVLVRLTAVAQALLRGADMALVRSDWEHMTQGHDPQGNQPEHTAHTVLTARMARLYGYTVQILPAEQPHFDLRLDQEGQPPLYVECEARKKGRAPRRVRKWSRQAQLQGACAVCAKTPPARAALVAEILGHDFAVLGTDLATLLQDPPEFWLTQA